MPDREFSIPSVLRRLLAPATPARKKEYGPDADNEGMCAMSTSATVGSMNSAATDMFGPNEEDANDIVFHSSHEEVRQKRGMSVSTRSCDRETAEVATIDKYQMLHNRRYSLYLSLLDRVVYLNLKDPKPVALRGSLLLVVHKPVQIKEIKLLLHGDVLVHFFYRADVLLESDRTQSTRFLSCSRNWPYDEDKVFSKGSYRLPFQFIVNNALPETMSNLFGFFSYTLDVSLTESKRYSSRGKTQTSKHFLEFVQCATEQRRNGIHPENQMISTANWRNLLYYKVKTWFDPPLAVGNIIHIQVKVLPIIRGMYKIRGIRVALEQTLHYSKEDAESEDYFADLVQTETIPLETVEIQDNQDPSTCKPYLKMLSIQLEQVYTKSCNGASRFVIVPSTNSIEEGMCPFKVRHEILVSLVLQQVKPTSDIHSTHNAESIPTPKELHSTTKTTEDTSSNEADDNVFIMTTGGLVEEPEMQDPYEQVELSVHNHVQILRSESKNGNLPPPSYRRSSIDHVIEDLVRSPSRSSRSSLPAYTEDLEPPAYVYT